jgi:ABC-type glycerol-3-phosphate transport system permease component
MYPVDGGLPLPDLYPILILLVGLVTVIGMIVTLRINAFIALICAALVVSFLGPGEWIDKVGRVAQAFGDTTASIGIVIALAAVIGSCLLESGSADRIVRWFLSLMGEKRADKALLSSGFVLAVPVFVIWSDWNLLDKRTGLILVYVAMNLPFAIWILYGFIAQIPKELEEAAVIDGCNPYQVFFWVVLPLIRPGLAAAAIFTFRIAWNEFILSLVLTNRYTRTLPVATSLFLTDHGIQWGKIMAMGTLIALPPLIFTFIAARQIITGLTAGAVKG